MKIQVIIELVVAADITGSALMASIESRLPQVEVDPDYQPVQVEPTPDDSKRLSPQELVVTVRGTVEQGDVEEITSLPGVLNVWSDAKVAPFSGPADD